MEEDTVLLHAQKQVGNRWSEISRLLPGRAENAVKNRFNSLITKRIAKRTASLAARAELVRGRDIRIGWIFFVIVPSTSLNRSI